MYGFYWRLGMPEQFDLLEDALQNVEMIVLWSSDPIQPGGPIADKNPPFGAYGLRKRVSKTVFIDPFYNYTNAHMDGTWLPIRPGADTALAMAIAYVWLTEGTYDKDYIAEKSLGFDEFADYILGKGEGDFPKTPEWAEEESGIPVRRKLLHWPGSGRQKELA